MSDQPTPSAVNNAATLQRLRENGIHSVFDVVREGRGAFVARMAGSSGEAEARQLYDLAMQRASGLARLHTSLLARDEPTHRALPKLASGGSRERMESLSLSESGDFESWFGQAGLFPAPDSVASLFSPASYLVDLYRVAKKLHATTSEYHIDKRRPDLAGLTLSQDRMTTELPTLELVNEILSSGIEASTTVQDEADALIANAIYPFGLPYDVRAAEISRGLQTLGTDENHLYDLLADVETEGLQSPVIGRLPEGARAGLGLSPGEYQLLCDTTASNALAATHWGGALPTTARELVEKSGLTLSDIHDVLGSVHAIREGATQPSDPLIYGATYLNHSETGAEPPALSLVVSTTDTDAYGTLVNKDRWEVFERLHRLIRLKALVPLTYEEIDWLWAQLRNQGPDLRLTIRLISSYLSLRERCGLSVDAFAAIVGHINRHARPGKVPFVAQLFQPGFSAFFYGEADFGSEAPTHGDTVPGRLARGLGIDQQTLRRLALIVANRNDGTEVSITVSDDFVASLYRIVQIPRVAGLSIDEGLALWSCMDSEPNATLRLLTTHPSSGLASFAQNILLKTLHAADWLRERHIDIPTLMALVSTRHRTTPTVDILQFIANIHDSVGGDNARFDSSRLESSQIEGHLARHTGAQFGLVPGIARAMIRWIDRVIDKMDVDLEGYSSAAFWEDIASTYRSATPVSLENIKPRAVQYCHLLGQFALACHLTGLQEQDITLIVAPESGRTCLYDMFNNNSYGIPPLTLDTVFWLYTYAEWREALPGSVAEARLHFGNSNADYLPYKISDFAEINGWNPEVATQIWTILGHPKLADMRHVSQLARWMKAASDLQLSPDKLVAMHTLVSSAEPAANSEQRATLAPAILGTVRAQASDSKSSKLFEQLAERRRDALLLHYLQHVVPATLKPEIKNPDDLYEYMLIDSQVSAKVKTSRIAEALASVQLYMHRCREGLEPDIDDAALANEMRPGGYFSFWDAYNKRYGTWAGLQRLLRYPASYIDPSLRYVKTTTFRSLEDALSQGRLTNQRAEEAFLAYAEATFEMLAVECVESYCDYTSANATVFFLGKGNKSPARYYWRQFRISRDIATAFTEWLPVDADIPVYTKPGERPSIVVFAGALHVLWWTWKTESVKATFSAGESGEAIVEPAEKLYGNIATLGAEKTWRTMNALLWDNREDLSQTYVGPYPDEDGTMRLLFVAGQGPDWNSPMTALRSFDRSLNADNGPEIAFGMTVPTDDNRRTRQPLLRRTDAGVEYLEEKSSLLSLIHQDWNPPGFRSFWVRDDGYNITSVTAPFFRERLREGIDSLLSLETQRAPIETSTAFGPPTPVQWHEGAGIYLWELFFHAPFLIACRLIDEQRFDEAETWLRRIFSPSGYVDAEGHPDTDEQGNVRYWNVVPLQDDTAWGPITSEGTDDPDSVAMADPMHYKLAVYLRWMQLYMDRGDMAYRQQTRDTMTEAKMWYVQATQLLGRRPYFHDVLAGYWSDPSLARASAATARSLDVLEAIVGDKELPSPPTQPGQVRIVDGLFLPPIDDGTLVWWDRFAQRLYNLRHGLSLDGQPLSLPLYETPVSPRELQQRRVAADGGGAGVDPGMIAMPSQRFSVLLDRARAAVQQLMQFGTTLQGILERRDSDALTVLQQNQQVDIQAMVREIHTYQIKALEYNAEGLQVARAQANDRKAHFARLMIENLNSTEIASMAMRTTAPMLLHASVGGIIAASALDMMPNTFIAGMAAGVGGSTWSAVAKAIAESLTTEANALEMTAGTLDMMAGFERRGEDWGLQADQAAREVAQLDTQIDAGKAAIDQAMKQATHMEIEQGFAQAVLDVLTTRFSGKDLFSWQSSRMSTLYYQLYDATLSLCGWAQQAYQFETQDSTAFLQPGAWDDRYQGLLAGESLALCLQRLERAYLFWDQRVMEVERTLSLGALAEKPLGELIAEALDTAQGAGVSGKLTVGYEADVLALTFTLADAGIGSDYPEAMKLGTLRRIKSIAVTLPAVLGAYEDVRAVLGYAGGAAATLPSGCTAVTLSRGVMDHGVFMFDFNDGKYLPFEGIPVDDTGTLSLRFPNAPERPQEDMLRSINDVILHVRYTILRE